MDERRTCIIGAGASGIIAAKTLHVRQIPFDCLEKGSGIGGVWRYGNDSGMSAAYKSLHINSSSQLMAFSDFPMPESYPDFPHHSHILEYYENFVDHFGFREQIQFQTTVKNVTPCQDGYRVTLLHNDRLEERTYANVVIANGHLWSPRVPEFPGSFHGESFHSFHYNTSAGLADKRVLIVGLGNSACDIASEVSRDARATCLSTRRGAHIIPKYIFGKPLDRIGNAFLWNYVPIRLLQPLLETVLYVTRGKLTRFGLPKPAHRVLEAHPTVASDLLNLIGHGKIAVKPGVKELAGHQVCFMDGTSAEFDVIIYATGYDIRFPFLDKKILNPRRNDVPLFKHVVHPSFPGLYFAGLVQPWGPVNPLSESQSDWIADLITSRGRLPGQEEMERAIANNREAMRKRYTNSERHTIQVDFYPYLRELQQVKARCRRLARQADRVPSQQTSATHLRRAA